MVEENGFDEGLEDIEEVVIPLNMAQLMDQILKQVAVEVPKFLASEQFKNLVGVDLAAEAGKLGVDLSKLGTQTPGKTAEGAAKGIGKGAEAIKEGVGGLLKGLKKK